MGRASRRKQLRRNPKPLYVGFEARFSRWLNQPQKINPSRYNKDVILALRYGAGPMSMMNVAGMTAQERRPRKHPLEGDMHFKFVPHDKRFGHVAVYKVNTKQIGSVFQGEAVPETDVWVRPVDRLWSASRSDAVAITWCRRHKLADIQFAVSWLLMQDKVPVILRAFEP